MWINWWGIFLAVRRVFKKVWLWLLRHLRLKGWAKPVGLKCGYKTEAMVVTRRCPMPCKPLLQRLNKTLELVMYKPYGGLQHLNFISPLIVSGPKPWGLKLARCLTPWRRLWGLITSMILISLVVLGRS